MTKKTNLAASVAARLLNRARETGDDYQVLLTRYCLERFLYRLGASALRDRFVLKGAMLLRLWSEQPYRATRDLDLLRRGEGAFDAIHADLRAITATPAPPDAVEFDVGRASIEAIRAQAAHVGVRATLPARLGKARLGLQIDIGIGDAVWPIPRTCTYPSLLDLPAPELFVYPKEAVIAEKLEAITSLGDRNSRIKDFFDLRYLASHFEFDREILTEAIHRTFARRNVPIPVAAPIGLTRAYWENPSRPPQVRAFARRAGLNVPDGFADECVRLLDMFFTPLLEDLRREGRTEGVWPPGGPWR